MLKRTFNDLHTTGYVLDMMQLVLEEIIHDPLPYVDAVLLVPVPQDLCAQLDRPSCVTVQSRGGLNPTYCPGASGNSLRVRSSTQEGITTRTLLPRKPQHQLTNVLRAKYLHCLQREQGGKAHLFFTFVFFYISEYNTE